MPDNRTTENESNHPVLDEENWEIALEPYKGNPGSALSLGMNLMILRAYLSVAPVKIRESIEALDSAMEVLYPYTEFHLVSFDLFVRLASGKLSFEEEQILNALGIKF